MGKRDEILDAAENMVRENGFHGMSFRDLATATGIKSASVHYHFPTKDDLGKALTERYKDKFISALPSPQSYDGQASGRVVETMRQAFRDAYFADGQMCLCGVLGTEAPGLPEETRDGTKVFFERLNEWLGAAFRHTNDGQNATDEQRETIALTLISRLEGAMMLSRAMGDMETFDRVTKKLN